MKKLIILLVSNLGFFSVWAQPTGAHPSYVSIQMNMMPADSLPNKQSVCGGVVVDEVRKLVITSWHCVPNSRPVIDNALSVNGMKAKLVGFSREADMALFQVEDLKGMKAPKFATPKKGDVVSATAFYDAFPVLTTMPDRYMPPMHLTTSLDWEGKVAAVGNGIIREGVSQDKLVQTKVKWIVVTGQSAPGFSGGPVFNKAGEYVGTISNVSGGFTNISSSENARILMKEMK